MVWPNKIKGFFDQKYLQKEVSKGTIIFYSIEIVITERERLIL